MRFSKQMPSARLCASIFFTFELAVSVAAGQQQIRGDLAQTAAFERQYHIAALPVSPAVLLPISAVESAVNRAANRRREIASERAEDRDEEAMREQYHEAIRLQIGLALAAVYVLFLAGWFWVTRIRPRRR